jgi:colanic acid/amylovoran biosynthesis glycosyltransferase
VIVLFRCTRSRDNYKIWEDGEVPSVIFEITSQGAKESQKNPISQLSTMGLPVISTWHGGIPELVENGVAGYLVPERDAGVIAEKLGILIDNADRWGAMGKAGRQKVKAMYDLNTLNDELVTIYQSILAAHTPRNIPAPHSAITDISEAVSLS